VRISELAGRSGLTLATIKYYLREGLLMSGHRTGATQATYGEAHLRRLALIRVLIDVAGLPVARVRTIVEVLDHPEPSTFESLGKAIGALPPYGVEREGEHPRAHRALALLDQRYEPDSAALAQLEAALAGLEAAGRPLSDDRLRAYARAMHTVAEDEIAALDAGSSSDTVEQAVLGTVLSEPLILALRRLAHQDVYLNRDRAG